MTQNIVINHKNATKIINHKTPNWPLKAGSTVIVAIVSEWLKFGLDIHTSFISMCRKLEVVPAVYVTCDMFWVTISGKCFRTRNTVAC